MQPVFFRGWLRLKRGLKPLAVLALASLVGLALFTQSAFAQRDPDGAGRPACLNLVKGSSQSGLGTPISILDATYVPATGSLPAFCKVDGYVAPNAGFELRLPASWNQKFFYAGCTGSCGFAIDSSWTRECDYPLVKGYACVVSDMGHLSTSSDGLWAFKNLGAQVDFGYRATHRTAIAAKKITADYYRQSPKHSYFMGCSTGGRQAMISVQRFPHDFDGVIAGAPVIDEAGTALSFLWNLRTLRDQGDKPVLTTDDLQLIHKAALAADDALDGLADGIITDPRENVFDPMSLVCRPNQSTRCLTTLQAIAVKRIYQGPTNSRGESLYPGGGFLPGSELNWTSFLPGPDGRAPAEQSGVDTTRYILSSWGPKWKLQNFNFDTDFQRLAEDDYLYSAGNPDLRVFKRLGGKLIIYHGWADAKVAPLNSVDYYEILERAMGGQAETMKFARLFMIPGMNHCFGGEGAFAVDYLSYLEKWVEDGLPPRVLRASHWNGGPYDASSMIRRFPKPKEQEAFTRPIYPFPERAKYSGSGSPKQMANFHPVEPTGKDNFGDE